ncbi:MAG: hypothetical protein ACRDRO_18545 [Pseudonocardiaceae bacterium]
MTMFDVLNVLEFLCGCVILWFALTKLKPERPAQRTPAAPTALDDLGDLSPAEYRDVHVNPWPWTAMRVGGGGVFTTPDLSRADAIEYVTRSGSHQLCAVDDVHKIIFYRSL